MNAVNEKTRYTKRGLLLRGMLPVFVAAALLCFAGAARAATFTVTRGDDGGAGTLRNAIGNANPGDTIVFEQIKQHYYIVHTDLNPNQIVPRGPDPVVWLSAHDRERPGGSPFGSHCVATHGIDLGDQGNIQRWVLLGNGDCSSKPCASCADDGDIGLDYVQFCLLEVCMVGSPGLNPCCR